MGKATGKSFTAQTAATRILPYLERGRTERFGVELLIGPEEAEFLLGNNPDNRKLRPEKTEQFISDMRHGRWHNNGESIVISRDGELNDGQHRLTAVLQTRIPQRFLIGFGYDRETRYTVDTGSARTAGDHLKMAGQGYTNSMAAVARMVIAYEVTKGKSLGRTNRVTSIEIQERVRSDELLQEVTIAAEKARVPWLRASIRAFCFYVLANIDPIRAREFMDQLNKGTDLSETSPIYVARERLMRRNLGTADSVEVIFRAWNYWATGDKMHRIQLMGQFPVLKRPRTTQPVSGDLPYQPPQTQHIIQPELATA